MPTEARWGPPRECEVSWHSTNGVAWIVSPRFDVGLILGPPLLAVLVVLSVPTLQVSDVPLWGWLVFVVCIDVAHVYASLYRTYWDPEEFARRRTYYTLTPLVCLTVGVVLHSIGALVFWRVLAYIAVFHFVRQQFGFVMLYRHRSGERSLADLRLDKMTIYSTMLYPLAFWHATSDRRFEWFIEGDFLSLPRWISPVALWIYSAILLAFLVRQVQIYRARGTVNWGKVGIVVSTACVWYTGIVLLNSDFAFTLTNVVAHGVPYMALVWIYGRRKWTDERSWRHRIHRPAAAGIFVGVLLVLAYFEEGLWDLFVWQEHAIAFGQVALPLAAPDALRHLVVPLLTVPQATHYVLDAWIWRFDSSNPGLGSFLFGEAQPTHGV